MIVDASAFLAILFDEPEASQMEDKILMATSPAMSPVNYLEAAVRVDGLGSEAKSRKFDELFEQLGIEIPPTNIEPDNLARQAYQHRRRGHQPRKLHPGTRPAR